MPSKPSRSSASVLGIQYGSSTRPSRRRSASISSGMRAVGADGGRAVADQRELGGGHGRACSPRRADHVQRSSVAVRSAIPDGPALPPHVRDRRPARRRSRPRRASSATRSRRSPSTSRCWRPTSARCCWRAARWRRPRRARGCSSTPSRSCCGSTPRAPTSRGWRPARRSGCGSARRRWRPAFAAELVAPALAVTVRVGARDEIARAVATGELDAGFVDGVAAAGDPLRLPETGAARGRRSRGAARGRRRRSTTRSLGRAVAARGPRRRALDRRARRSARRWPSSPRSPAPTASAPRCTYDGADVAGCSRWSPPATGSRCCPSAALDGVAALPLVAAARSSIAPNGSDVGITPPLLGVLAQSKRRPSATRVFRHGRHRRSRRALAPRARLPAAGDRARRRERGDGRRPRRHRPRDRRSPRRLGQARSTATSAGSRSRSCSRSLSFVGHAILFRAVSVDGGGTARIGFAPAPRSRSPATPRRACSRRAGAGGIALTAWALKKSGMEARDVAARMTTFMVLLYAVYMGALRDRRPRPLQRRDPGRRLVRDDDRARDLRRAP